MKTLILMRHAKSDWSTGAASDFDRPLNARGRKSAVALGNWLRENGLIPKEAHISAARRTRETWNLLGIEAVEPKFHQSLYHASPTHIAAVLRQAQADRVILIAHNPGTALLAQSLLKPGNSHPEGYDRYPTCATAIISFPIETWEDLKSGTGTLLDFVLPRTLIA